MTRIAIFGGNHEGRTFGGGPVSFVLRHLSAREPYFGPALTEIELRLWYRWGDLTPQEIRRGFTQSHARHADTIAGLPKRRFERKRGRLKIDWFADQDRMDVTGIYLGQLTLAQFDRAFDHVIAAMTYALKAMKKSDDFEPAGFMAWLEQVRAEPRPDGPELVELMQADFAHLEALQAKKDPWDQLGIDWDRYPARARELLDEPSDWDCGDDFSPHGNDTGADMLSEWWRYARSRPLAAVNTLFGEAYIPATPSPDDEHRWWLWVEVHLALAFGHIKKKAKCPSDLAGATLAVLAVEREAAEKRADWPSRDEWLSRLDRYVAILRKFG